MKRIAGVLAAGTATAVVIAASALAASSPAVVTEAATGTTQTSAELHGTVNPNGSSTTYYFQWGLTNQYGVNGRAHSAGAGTRSVSVAESATDLIPGTSYHFRLVASNGDGTSVGADRTFTTAGHPPPGVTTGPATGLNKTGATLTGIINPSGQSTSWFFQWGATTSYGQQTAAQTLSAGTAQAVAASLQGLLAPGTIYHYRLVATHGSANATTYGGDGTFMTFPFPRPAPSLHVTTKPRTARHRPYEFTTTGSIAGPASIPPAYGCSGDVRVRFLNGTRRAATTFAAVQPNCTFSAVTKFRKLPHHAAGQKTVTLKMFVTFLGNNYLAIVQVRGARVTVG